MRLANIGDFHETRLQGDPKWWTPDHNSTFVMVPDEELRVFETAILKPYFDAKLAESGIEL